MDEQNFEYRTGRTQPKKSSSGLVTGLLICIIFLCGLVSALGLMNIRLFRLLENSRQETAPLSFAQGEAGASTADSLVLEGMALQELDPVYQQLHGLPQGLYVSQVCEGSGAEQLGIAPGDVLISYAGTAVSSLEGLKALQNSHKPGDRVEIITCRDGQENHLTLTLTEQQE